jgi:transcriptional regulator with XRE-family HTH domain
MNRAATCECLQARVEKIDVHRTELPGLEVVLHGVAVRIVCDACNQQKIRIPNLPGLIAATALVRVLEPYKLNGHEIRVVRKALGWSAKELAERLVVTPETVSRWENDKEPIGLQSEKLLRHTAAARLTEKAPRIAVDLKQVSDMKIRSCRDTAARPTIALELAPSRDASEEYRETLRDVA